MALAMEKTDAQIFLLAAPLGSAGSVNALRVSPLVSTDGETIHVDVKLVTLALRQHRENATVKNASVDDKSVSNHCSPFPTAVQCCHYLRNEAYLEFHLLWALIVLAIVGIATQRRTFETRRPHWHPRHRVIIRLSLR
jgi:hypothetical protein